MDIQEGDIVKVANPKEWHSGLADKTGTVLSVNESSQTCVVDLKWAAPEGSGLDTEGILGAFFFKELEVIKAIDQEEQIFKIASALHTECQYGDIPWVEIKADAARLYKVGVRHRG